MKGEGNGEYIRQCNRKEQTKYVILEERKESGNQKNLQQKRMDILGPFKVVLTEALILGLYN